MNRGSAAGRPHARLINEYVARNPGTQTRGFRKNITAAIRGDCIPCPHVESDDCDCGHVEGCFGERCWPEEEIDREAFSMVPDAYRIDKVEKRLWVAEAQDTHPLSNDKLDLYLWMFWHLDAAEWDLFIHLIDRNGSVLDLDVSGLAFEFLSKSIPDNYSGRPGRIIWPEPPKTTGKRT